MFYWGASERRPLLRPREQVVNTRDVHITNCDLAYSDQVCMMAPQNTRNSVGEAHLETGTMKRDIGPGAPGSSSAETKNPASSDGLHDSREQLAPQALETYGMDFTGSFARSARPSMAVPIRPRYRRRSYFTDGWTETYLWKAAVRAVSRAPCRAVHDCADHGRRAGGRVLGGLVGVGEGG